MRLARRPEPFDHPDWIYEIKFDGFRGLAYVEEERCRLVSRRRHEYTSFRHLNASIGQLLVQDAVIDGEIVCLDRLGRSQFYELMFHRGEPYFYAFDLLWLNGQDLRELPLLERKRRCASSAVDSTADSCISITSIATDQVCFAKRVSSTWRASSRSGRTVATSRTNAVRAG
jgi:ATP-dependent DNA ligase